MTAPDSPNAPTEAAILAALGLAYGPDKAVRVVELKASTVIVSVNDKLMMHSWRCDYRGEFSVALKGMEMKRVVTYVAVAVIPGAAA